MRLGQVKLCPLSMLSSSLQPMASSSLPQRGVSVDSRTARVLQCLAFTHVYHQRSEISLLSGAVLFSRDANEHVFVFSFSAISRSGDASATRDAQHRD